MECIMPGRVAYKSAVLLPVLLLGLVGSNSELGAATFGQVVAIGGQAADLALDEARGLIYVANFTANRVDVVSMASRSVQTSINVAPFRVRWRCPRTVAF
jgi:DNA-binding beta-propeller fold protein YncE